MSTGILIFAVAALWLWIKVRKAYAGRGERKQSALESLFDMPSSDSDGSYVNSDAPFASEEADAGYFTYETSEQPQAEQPRPKSRTAKNVRVPESPVPAAAEAIEVSEKPDFDLRQAILYQTILDNKYLSEVQSLDN